MKFEVSGTQYELDASPEKLMGDELILIDDQLAAGWAQRWADLDLGIRDIIVITYLAAKRAGETRPYEEFVKSIAPLTFKPIAEPANRAERRASAKAAPKKKSASPAVEAAEPATTT